MKNDVAVFGGGCFWCTEAVFKMMKGVVHVEPGYTGGTTPNPTYEEVCGGRTGYVEVARVEYDPSQVRYDDLLTVFFGSHDPTTVNRQGNDVGTQYRSVIFTTTDAQKVKAKAFIHDLNASNQMGKPIVTDVEPLTNYYPAESYHHDYYANNPNQGYCELVINPKLEKVKEKYATLLKEL